MSMQKTLLVTGASSGFGRALFHAGLKAGHTVVGAVRRGEEGMRRESHASIPFTRVCFGEHLEKHII
jgi:NAD(P)-dependent dehydrogenase (short-subunit alcohol dehydrogenase family)